MSDFLAKLAGRTLGLMPVAQARGESLFAPPWTPAPDLTVTAITANPASRPVQARLTPPATPSLPSRRPTADPEPEPADSWAAPAPEHMAQRPKLRPSRQNHDLDLEIETPADDALFPPQATPRRQSDLAPLLDEPDVTHSSAPAPAAKTVNVMPRSQPSQTVASLDPDRQALIKPVAMREQPGVDPIRSGVQHPSEPIIGSTIRGNAEQASLLVPLPTTANSRAEQRLINSQTEQGASSRIEQNGRVHAVDNRVSSTPSLPNNNPPTPTIQITIGRVEVRAVQQTPPTRPRPATPAAPTLSLEAYLRGQKGGSR